MLKLRTILLSNTLYYVIVSLAIIYLFISLIYFNKIEVVIPSEIVGTIINVITDDEKEIYTVKIKRNVKVLARHYVKNNNYYSFGLGDKVLVIGEEKSITNNTVPNTFNYKKYLERNHIYKVINVNKMVLKDKNKNIFYKLRVSLLKRSNKLALSKKYIKSLLFGDNSTMDSDIIDTYKDNGISHLFAISGLHIGLFMKILEGILKKLKVRENQRYILIILFLILYMFVTDFSMSVVRCSIFTILMLINKIFYFYIKPINLLLLTISIIIFYNPNLVYQIGLEYSFTISFFLILCQDKLKNKKFFHSLFLTSVISFLASLPITIYHFSQVNLLSLFYNLFFIPFMSYLLLPLVLISYFLPFLDEVLYFFIRILEFLSMTLDKISFGKLIFMKPSLFFVIIFYILLIILFKRFNKKLWIIFFLILSFYYFYPDIKKENYYLAFDVSQGDSSLLVIGNNVTLIDTGGKVSDDNLSIYVKNRIIPYLKSQGIRKIDNLVLTHGDYDHMGEAINLVNNFKVEKVIFNCEEYNDLEKELIKVLDKKKIKYYSCIKELNIDNNKLYFLQTKEYDNENDNSNVIYTELNGYKFMFMGDASITTEKEIISKYDLLDIDVLKVGHHGSKTSSSKEFIDEINPKYSIISVGKNNRYGHPNKEVLNNLDNSKIYRTDQGGSIMFKINNNKLKIETYIP